MSSFRPRFGSVYSASKPTLLNCDPSADRYAQHGDEQSRKSVKKKHEEARRQSTRESRRSRIKMWYLENHNWEFRDSLFEEEDENTAFDATEQWEMHGDFSRCAEHTEEKEFAEAFAERQRTFEMMDMIRKMKGNREDDGDALLTIFMELSGQ
jgi:hypothetical protein